MIAEKNPLIGKAVGVLKELSADERTRMIYEDREKARRDIASMLSGAKREGMELGKLEGIAEVTKIFALNLIRRNRDIEEIIEDTGLSREQIELLRRS